MVRVMLVQRPVYLYGSSHDGLFAIFHSITTRKEFPTNYLWKIIELWVSRNTITNHSFLSPDSVSEVEHKNEYLQHSWRVECEARKGKAEYRC